jgi:Protein of unknown function (DUF2634)
MAEEDKRSPIFNWETGEFEVDLQNRVITVTEGAAMEQIILKAQNTARGVYLIYANVDDPDRNHIYGSDTWEVLREPDLPETVRIDELKRAIREAIEYDPWVTEVSEIRISRTPEGGQPDELNPAFLSPNIPELDAVYCTLTVSTIWDNNVTIEGVQLDG